MGKRLTRIDELRGLTLISMILYHFMWDLYYIAGISMEWYIGPAAHVWQQSICITFILISGFCYSLGGHHVRRAMTVFVAGVLVSAVTIIFMPDNRIVFGILTFLGSAGFIMIIIDRVHVWLEDRLDAVTFNITMLVASILLFISTYNIADRYINVFFCKISLPAYLYRGYIATYFGFLDNTFFSTDYFSILPWIFIYMAGYYLYRVLEPLKIHENSIKNYLKGRPVIPFADFLGRKSLIVYLLHQPVLYALTIVVKNVVY